MNLGSSVWDFPFYFYISTCVFKSFSLIRQKCHVSCVKSRVEHIVEKLGDQLFSWIISIIKGSFRRTRFPPTASVRSHRNFKCLFLQTSSLTNTEASSALCLTVRPHIMLQLHFWAPYPFPTHPLQTFWQDYPHHTVLIFSPRRFTSSLHPSCPPSWKLHDSWHFSFQISRAFCQALGVLSSWSSGYHLKPTTRLIKWSRSDGWHLNSCSWSLHLLWVEDTYNPLVTSSTGMSFLHVFLVFSIQPSWIGTGCSHPFSLK